MDESAFTVGFCDFVRSCIPSFEAAAVLVCLLREPERGWSGAGVVEKLRASVSITTAEAERCLELFEARGLVARAADGAMRFRPRGYVQEAHARTLAQAYVYALRVLGFIVILAAIIDKNVSLRASGPLQLFSAPSTSSSIFFASPNSMRLFSL